MPQFDQTSFFNQVIWFFFFFLIFYFIITFYFLPIISSTLKFRKKYIYISKMLILKIKKNKISKNIELNVLYTTFFKNLKRCLSKTKNYNNLIINKILKNIKNIDFINYKIQTLKSKYFLFPNKIK